MGIESTLIKVCNQTAVYWGSPTNNGTGGKTFAAAVEIQVRWVNESKVINTVNSETLVSMATIYVLQDVEVLAWIYLGALTDLSAQELANPKLVDTAYEIKHIDKIPSFDNNEHVRKAYL